MLHNEVTERTIFQAEATKLIHSEEHGIVKTRLVTAIIIMMKKLKNAH